MYVSDISIAITAADGASGTFVNVEYWEPEREGGYITAVDEIAIKWGKSQPWEHDSPSSARLKFRLSPEYLKYLEYDSEFVIYADFPASNFSVTYHATLFRGWVTSAAYIEYPQWISAEVELIDVVGRAAGMTIGDTPWPEETAIPRRSQRLAALAPDLVSTDWTYDASADIGMAAARDVDNANLLEVAQRTAAASRQIIIGKASGLAPGRPAGPAFVHGSDPNGPWLISVSQAGQFEFPIYASHIDKPRKFRMDRTSRITRVSVSYVVEKQDQWRYFTLQKVKSLSDFRISTDGTTAENWSAVAMSLLSNNQRPSWEIEPLDLYAEYEDFRDIPEGAPANYYAHLIHMDSRTNALVHLYPQPKGIEAYWHVVAGQIVVRQRTDQRGKRLHADVLGLQLRPASLSGVHPLLVWQVPSMLPGVKARQARFTFNKTRVITSI